MVQKVVQTFMPTIANHADNLNAARKESSKKPLTKAKKAIADTVNVMSLLTYINPFIDWLFGIGLTLAILKDILDIVNNALIVAGGVGEILIIIFTFFISIFIFLLAVITGSVGKVKLAKSIIKKTLLLIATGIAEAIPAIDLLPMETILVCIIFWMTLKERKKAAEEARENELTNTKPIASPA